MNAFYISLLTVKTSIAFGTVYRAGNPMGYNSLIEYIFITDRVHYKIEGGKYAYLVYFNEYSYSFNNQSMQF
jgi:hypothetical protein